MGPLLRDTITESITEPLSSGGLLAMINNLRAVCRSESYNMLGDGLCDTVAESSAVKDSPLCSQR